MVFKWEHETAEQLHAGLTFGSFFQVLDGVVSKEQNHKIVQPWRRVVCRDQSGFSVSRAHLGLSNTFFLHDYIATISKFSQWLDWPPAWRYPSMTTGTCFSSPPEHWNSFYFGVLMASPFQKGKYLHSFMDNICSTLCKSFFFSFVLQFTKQHVWKHDCFSVNPDLALGFIIYT